MRVLVMEEAFVNAKRNDPCPCGSAKSSRAVIVSGKVWVRRKEIISLCNN
jgi:hypothetical protein